MSETGIITVIVTVILSIVAFRWGHRLYRGGNLPTVSLSPNASDAERLAHLLVAELELYNVQEVEAIARGAMPSPELLDEVGAARTMYQERIPPLEQGEHFEAAVLAILAGGKQSMQAKLLGRR